MVLTTNGNAHVCSGGPGMLRALTNGPVTGRMVSAYRNLKTGGVRLICNRNNSRVGTRLNRRQIA